VFTNDSFIIWTDTKSSSAEFMSGWAHLTPLDDRWIVDLYPHYFKKQKLGFCIAKCLDVQFCHVLASFKFSLVWLVLRTCNCKRLGREAFWHFNKTIYFKEVCFNNDCDSITIYNWTSIFLPRWVFLFYFLFQGWGGVLSWCMLIWEKLELENLSCPFLLSWLINGDKILIRWLNLSLPISLSF
jgi:hypothetical protein